MPTSPSLTHCPTTKALLLASTSLTIASSIVDIKHLLPIRPTPHLYPFLQFSRLLTYQLAYTNSSELLFSCVLLYNLRVLERIWGTRKYTSFILSVFVVNVLLVPAVVVALYILTAGRYNHLPSGSTAVITAGIAAWSSETPSLYKYRILTSRPTPGPRDAAQAATTEESLSDLSGITLSDKTTTYVLTTQLALSQFPYNLLPAVLGWVVGQAWRGDLLPFGLGRRRVPGWIVGEGSRKERERYEGLRRRLEEEGGTGDGMRQGLASGTAEGSGSHSSGETRRRNPGGGVGAQIREWFGGVQ